MRKTQRDTAWKVANGLMSKSEAAKVLKVDRRSVDTQLFNGLVEVLKGRNIVK